MSLRTYEAFLKHTRASVAMGVQPGDVGVSSLGSLWRMGVLVAGAGRSPRAVLH